MHIQLGIDGIQLYPPVEEGPAVVLMDALSRILKDTSGPT